MHPEEIGKSAWREDFAATELAARIEALSGARVTRSDLIPLLQRYGASSRGAGPYSYRLQITGLRRALPEIVLAAGWTERHKYHLDLG